MKPLLHDRLAARLFGTTRALALLRAAWPAAVGPELARRTEVLALQGQTLRVRVPDAIWRRGLLRMRGEILARLRAIVGPLAPRQLAFSEGPPRPGAESPPPQPQAQARGVGARAAAPAALVDAAATIPDPELREAFLAAAVAYLGRFAGPEA
jgi:predicted nucleic acid-binding Zn ribbon protein